MIAVRTSVAKSESTPRSPTFANTAVNAANPADSSAQTSHAELVGMRAAPSYEAQLRCVGFAVL
jgi:hypothetical protein